MLILNKEYIFASLLLLLTLLTWPIVFEASVLASKEIRYSIWALLLLFLLFNKRSNLLINWVFIFTFIFLVVGGISMSTGLYSPMALIVQTWVWVFLFDVVFGVFPSPNPALMASGIPTIIVGIIAIAIMLRENMR